MLMKKLFTLHIFTWRLSFVDPVTRKLWLCVHMNLEVMM